MKVLITDANIFIDLLKTASDELFFKLDYDMFTTQAVIDECNDVQRKVLFKHIGSGRLSIFHLQSEDDEVIESMVLAHGGLSYADCTVLHAASSLKAVLLTGDRDLRKTTQRNDIEVRGIFWIFDEMLKQKIFDNREYKQKLLKLKDVNQWLPKEEFEHRLK